MEHYEKQAARREDARLAALKDGKVVTVYDDSEEGRFPEWMPVIGASKRKTT